MFVYCASRDLHVLTHSCPTRRSSYLKREADAVALIRIEQLYPFPRELLAAELKRYKATDVVWCLEEPHNQGAWYQIRHHLVACLSPKQTLHYAGRARSPSPAVGHFTDHVIEQKQLVADTPFNPLADAVVAAKSQHTSTLSHGAHP